MSQHEPAQPTPSAAGKTERGADEGRQATAGLLLPCACCLKACYSHVPAPATATCQLPAGLLLPRASCLQVCYSHVPAACRPATAMCHSHIMLQPCGPNDSLLQRSTRSTAATASAAAATAITAVASWSAALHPRGSGSCSSPGCAVPGSSSSSRTQSVSGQQLVVRDALCLAVAAVAAVAGVSQWPVFVCTIDS